MCNLPVFVSTHKLLNLIFSPIVEKGGWEQLGGHLASPPGCHCSSPQRIPQGIPLGTSISKYKLKAPRGGEYKHLYYVRTFPGWANVSNKNLKLTCIQSFAKNLSKIPKLSNFQVCKILIVAYGANVPRIRKQPIYWHGSSIPENQGSSSTRMLAAVARQQSQSSGTSLRSQINNFFVNY